MALAPDRPQQRRRARGDLLRARLAQGAAVPARRRAAARVLRGARASRCDDCGKLVVALDAAEVERLRELERRAHRERRPGHPLARARRAARDRAARRRRRRPALADDRDHRLPRRRRGVRRRRARGRRDGPPRRRGDGIERRRRDARVETADDAFEFDRLVDLRGAAVRPRRPARRRRARADDRPVPRRVLPARAGARTARPRAPLSGARSRVSVPRRALHDARPRRRRRRAQRRARVRARGIPPPRRPRRRHRRDASVRGFRALARRHWRMGAARVPRRRCCKAAFAAEARRYIPDVSADDLVPAPAGVRAQALDPDGSSSTTSASAASAP